MHEIKLVKFLNEGINENEGMEELRN